jgi:monofunctional biosynthetic peptidoglycan transglycosylase
MGVEAALPIHERPAVAAPSRARAVAVRVAQWVAVALLAYWVVAVLLLVAYRFVAPPITGVQLQRRIEALASGRDYDPRRNWVDYERLPMHVRRAVVAAEDLRFWTHWGFDFTELKKVGADVLDGGRPRGASTITQQLVKNLFGCACRNPVRKIYDWTLTVPAEIILGKERILELYLNNVELGDGVWGVDAAARHYYGIGARSMTRSQAAGLAAILPAPRVRKPTRMGEYRSEILRRMALKGW